MLTGMFLSFMQESSQHSESRGQEGDEDFPHQAAVKPLCWK